MECITRLKNALRAAEAFADHDPGQAEEYVRVACHAALRRLARRKK